ncbi:MAG: ABC transporter ATP-binding protein/permease [Candidatus Krumholzibacteria bacterium]|nr:ABC transporter ATP-binding protein/permease [Candidatus Krumholzibacteria bacterium]MDH5269861.1 ABC transporter ATP-binding protein/permease [Candidatus Krumholzibacteria bacterium]
MMGSIKYSLSRIDPVAARRVAARFREELRPHRGRIFLAMAGLTGASLMTLLQPWPLKFVFDRVLIGSRVSGPAGFPPAEWSPVTTLWVSALAFLVIAVLRGALTYVFSIQSKIVEHQMTATLRQRVFAHVQRLPQSYHDYRETGDLLTRITGDINLLSELLVTTSIGLVSHTLLVVGMLAVLLWLDPLLAVIGLVIIPIFALAAFRFSGRIRSSARKQREAYGEIVSAVQESLAGIAQVKSFAQEKRREKLVGRSVGRDAKANVRTARLTENYARTVDMISAAGTCAVLIVGSYRAMAGLITPGDVLVVMSYLRSMYRPLRDFAKLTAHAAKAVVRADKIIELLDIAPETQDMESALSAREIRGDIAFENVRFQYSGGKQALRDVTFRIPAGRTTMIVGATGAGKSTIAKLILRLYEPVGGRILLDGHDIRDYRIDSLRKRISPLTQESFLFRSSIAENIAFGARNATAEEIQEVAARVGADDFIQTLPHGYDTLVGEGGATLSGGQRQRVSFARALLRNSPLMIFDEPATGLDVHAEAAAKELLARTREGRTLIVITHRLHFLELADWVVYVRDGEVLEQGDPQELAGRRGAFWEFVRHGDVVRRDGPAVEGRGA